jgi:hypothetical protein
MRQERSGGDQAGKEAHMSDMERSELDDTEGHALRSQDEDREAVTEDVEGDGFRYGQDTEAADEDDVEGHALRSQDQG